MREAAALIAPIVERRIRRNILVETLPRIVNPDHHQPFGMRVGQRPPQHPVDDAEDGRVRAGAEATVNSAIAVNPGLLVSARMVYLRSDITALYCAGTQQARAK